MRRIGIVTAARSDYGIYQPILRRMVEEPELEPALFVTGMHLAPEFGLTVRAIEADGYPIAERVDMLLSSDSPIGIAMSMGVGLMGLSQAYARQRPELLVVLGDRFEMHTAALAALPLLIPVAHIHGGEISQGAFDDALRHSMTKLSHLHFVATEEAAQRVRQLGEEPWRVVTCGAPSLDHLAQTPLLSRDELAARHGVRFFGAPPLVATFHPVTLEPGQAADHIRELLAALKMCGQPVIFTSPNADPEGRLIREHIDAFVAHQPQAQWVSTLGTQAYFSLMSVAAAMVGNSSSGLIEAPSFGLPVVNIGTRQEGRTRDRNVIDVGYNRQQIAEGIRRALSAAFRGQLRGLVNPYGDGHASERIVQRLREVALDSRLLKKRFVTHPVGRSTQATRPEAAYVA